MSPVIPAARAAGGEFVQHLACARVVFPIGNHRIAIGLVANHIAPLRVPCTTQGPGKEDCKRELAITSPSISFKWS